MILKTQRLILRRAAPRDLGPLHAIYGHRDAMRYWSTPPDKTLQDTQARLDGQITAPDPLSYFVVEKDGVAIGNAGMHADDEIGFILHPDHWRQGLMAEAMGAIIPYLFDTFPIERLTADADPLNTGSLAVLKSLGFVETGRAENTFCINGVWSDSVYLALPRPT